MASRAAFYRRLRSGQYAEVNDINLYYETYGGGRTVGPATRRARSGEMFGPILPTLAEHHQVIVPDLQGHGRTADIDRAIDVRLMADDIAALIDHLGLEKPDLVGFSLRGGWRSTPRRGIRTRSAGSAEGSGEQFAAALDTPVRHASKRQGL